MRRLVVTDHAVLRYLERARVRDLAAWRDRGVDVEAVRAAIATAAARGVTAGASAVRIDGVRLVLRAGMESTAVVTALDRRTARRASAQGRRADGAPDPFEDEMP